MYYENLQGKPFRDEQRRIEHLFDWTLPPFEANPDKRESMVRSLVDPEYEEEAGEKLKAFVDSLSASHRKEWQDSLLDEGGLELSKLSLAGYCAALLGLDSWEPESGDPALLRRNCQIFISQRQRIKINQEIVNKNDYQLRQQSSDLESAQEAYQVRNKEIAEIQEGLFLFKGCIVGKLANNIYEAAPALPWGGCNNNRRFALIAWSLPYMETPQQILSFYVRTQGTTPVTLKNGVQTSWDSIYFMGDLTLREELSEELRKLRKSVQVLQDSIDSDSVSKKRAESEVTEATSLRDRTQRSLLKLFGASGIRVGNRVA